MNKEGYRYCEEVNRKWKTIKADRPEFNDSQITERIMRLGIEAKVYEIWSADAFSRIALATLREDCLKRLNAPAR